MSDPAKVMRQLAEPWENGQVDGVDDLVPPDVVYRASSPPSADPGAESRPTRTATCEPRPSSHRSAGCRRSDRPCSWARRPRDHDFGGASWRRLGMSPPEC